jgi:NAD(P)-dependent dehydrogenase (short-subunit alcohol dehydrogenase family)
MTLPSTVLILGARGRFGLAAAHAFAAAGWRVLGQVRPGAALPAVPRVQWQAVALQDTAALAALVRSWSMRSIRATPAAPGKPRRQR